MTPGVALLLQQAALVAHARGWDKEKLVKKIEDLLVVLNGGDPPAHSALNAQAEPTMTEQDQSVVAQAEKMLSEILSTPPPATGGTTQEPHPPIA